MARSKALADRLAKLSPEKRALLQKRFERAGRTEIKNAGVGGVDGGESSSAADSQPASTELMGVRTSLETLLRQPAAPLVDDALWETLVELGGREARARDAAEDLREEAALGPEINGKAVAFISLALARMGAFREPGEAYTLDELKEHCSVLPDYRKALRRWIGTLVEDGLIETEGERFRNRHVFPPNALVEPLSEHDRNHYSENLAAIMTGRKHPLEFLIPEGSSEHLEENYARSPIFRYCNGVSAALLSAVVERLPTERRIRMLEIGAGTGGTSVSLLPVLPRDRAVYVYTDVSRFFVDLGRRKFAQYPFLHFAELDIDEDPQSLVGTERPALGEGTYDVIVAAHVLHATRDLRKTLKHVVSLLAPGGLLLLLEETRFLRNFHFTMGFLPGFDHFEDYDLRPMHPLLDASQWERLLRSEGFSKFAAFTAPGSLPDQLGVDVMLAQRRPSVSEGAPSSGDSGIPRRRDRERAPLTFAQERLWHYARSRPGSSLHNVFHGVRWRGRLDIALLERCLHAILRRHEILRTRFIADGEEASSLVESEAAPVFEVRDLRGVLEVDREARMSKEVQELAADPFELDRGPLLRTAVFLQDAEESVLFLFVHHIIIDGWSLMLLVREVAGLYESLLTSESSPPTEPEASRPLQFGDFAAWQRRQVAAGAFDQQLQYWRRQLEGWSGAPIVDSAAGAGSAAKELRGARETRVLSNDQLRRIKAFSRRSRVTLFTTLLTAFKVLLYRLEGETDVVVGTPAAGRGREELEGLVGLLLNMLPLRTRFNGNPTYIELLGRVREVTLDAFANQDLPFEHLLSEIGLARPDRTLPFRTVFNQPTHGAGEDKALEAGGVTIEPFLTGEVGSEVDLVFYAVEQDDGLRVHFVYNAEVFGQDQRAALIEQYGDLLEEIIKHPERRLG